MPDELSRRRFLGLATGAAAASAACDAAGPAPPEDPGPGPFDEGDRGRILPARPFRFIAHERAQLAAAVDRLIPPYSDGAIDFPGAHAAGAVRYVENLLGAFDDPASPPRIYAIGWPRSPTDPSAIPAVFLLLEPIKRLGWQREIQRLQQLYVLGLRELDRAHPSGRPFLELTPAEQTALLATFDPAGTLPRQAHASPVNRRGEPERMTTQELRVAFFDALFEHTMEGVYGDPAYGGNLDRVGWRLVGYEGPSLPRGYSDDEIREFGPPRPGSDPGALPALLVRLRAGPAGER